MGFPAFVRRVRRPRTAIPTGHRVFVTVIHWTCGLRHGGGSKARQRRAWRSSQIEMSLFRSEKGNEIWNLYENYMDFFMELWNL